MMGMPQEKAYGSRIRLLDGPMGTELNRRGVSTPLPLWSAAALETAPSVVTEIHRDYASAGATVHTANTFRTKQRNCGDEWRRWTRLAVELVRGAVPRGHRVFGSIAPLEDCYQPQRSPGEKSYGEHLEMAEELVAAGCDGLLCETFANPNEAIAAIRAASSTGAETWLAITAGPSADLISPEVLVRTAERAVQCGVSALLINCIPATHVNRFLCPLAASGFGIPIGVYANAGHASELIGWRPQGDSTGALDYASLAKTWVDQGATIIGGCCGTGPEHIAACRTLCEELGWLGDR